MKDCVTETFVKNMNNDDIQSHFASSMASLTERCPSLEARADSISRELN